MSGEEKPEFIQPPNTLKSKVSLGPGGVDLDALERAEAVIANLKDNYLEWVEDDLVKIQAFYDRLAATAPEERKPLLQDVFRVAHDIKGQGGSFGYHLMTQLGNQLCRFIEGIKECGPTELEAIKVHIDAMRLVIGSRWEGDGGNQGKNLVAGLQLVLNKFTK